LSRLLGVPASTSEDVLLRTLAARALGATGATRPALEARVLSQWSTATGESRVGEHGAESFVAEVLDAASDPRTKRFGDHKAFIASVFETYKNKHDGQDWDRFGRRLLEAHLRGALRLARADLVPAMDRQLIDQSELTYENATFHFLEVP
jgi:hypothetical protein